MELSIPLLGAVVTVLTVAFAVCLCCASGCCPTLRYCKEQRRRNALLRYCRKVRFSSSSKCCANETCSICLEDFREREKLVVTTCRHGFHKNCILHCLDRSPNCPMCKAPVHYDREISERTALL